MKQAITFVILVLQVETVFASADSIGPSGIISSGLSLDGSGVGVGQLEPG